jgi:hypothetical protein
LEVQVERLPIPSLPSPALQAGGRVAPIPQFGAKARSDPSKVSAYI